MYRTDKQFMKNPATASSRIYIGNIAEYCVATDLEERFTVYGKILGLVLQRGFAFIQYQTDSQAQAAIRNEHGSMFCSRKLNVRQAVDKTRGFPPNTSLQQQPQALSTSAVQEQRDIQQSPQQLQQLLPQPQSQQFQTQSENLQQNQQKSPYKKQQEQQQHSYPDHNQQIQQEKEPLAPLLAPPAPTVKLESNESFELKPQPQKRALSPEPDPSQQGDESNISNISHKSEKNVDKDVEFQNRQPDINSEKPLKRNRRSKRSGSNKRNLSVRDLEGDRRRDFDRFPQDDYKMREVPGYYGREESYRPSPSFIPQNLERPERNDCEIIVVSKPLTEFAEYIENRLKGIGLVVDLLFPNEDVPIGRVLANISSRGCLYAILVMPQNEEFRSLTLNILHGVPQEHRNMPIDDALMLITRNFDAYMRGEQLPPSATVTPTLTDRHSEQIQMIINLLAENRQLTTTQYDRILKYLHDRRVLQREFEIAEGVDVGCEPEPYSKQAELQSRIMNILNKANEDMPKPTQAPSSRPTPLLNDPSVQKALDSLLSGDMFKSLASGM